MELFTSKESFKEKVDSNNSWKTAWPRMILEWHLLLRLSLGFVWKTMSSFKREEGERERERKRERHTHRETKRQRDRETERERRGRERGGDREEQNIIQIKTNIISKTFFKSFLKNCHKLH